MTTNVLLVALGIKIVTWTMYVALGVKIDELRHWLDMTTRFTLSSTLTWFLAIPSHMYGLDVLLCE